MPRGHAHRPPPPLVDLVRLRDNLSEDRQRNARQLVRPALMVLLQPFQPPCEGLPRALVHLTLWEDSAERLVETRHAAEGLVVDDGGRIVPFPAFVLPFCFNGCLALAALACGFEFEGERVDGPFAVESEVAEGERFADAPER
ncbi:hypothetical protein EMGR_008623 [Emarellia grisea]|jgi:hypothetical protein